MQEQQITFDALGILDPDDFGKLMIENQIDALQYYSSFYHFMIGLTVGIGAFKATITVKSKPEAPSGKGEVG